MTKQTCTLLAGIMLAASIHAGDLTVDNLTVNADAKFRNSLALFFGVWRDQEELA